MLIFFLKTASFCRNFSIIGFDASQSGHQFFPSLSTVDLNQRTTGSPFFTNSSSMVSISLANSMTSILLIVLCWALASILLHDCAEESQDLSAAFVKETSSLSGADFLPFSLMSFN
ncbi:unnamed protein product, partial [Nesidiocoris tenuis]